MRGLNEKKHQKVQFTSVRVTIRVPNLTAGRYCIKKGSTCTIRMIIHMD